MKGFNKVSKIETMQMKITRTVSVHNSVNPFLDPIANCQIILVSLCHCDAYVMCVCMILRVCKCVRVC